MYPVIFLAKGMHYTLSANCNFYFKIFFLFIHFNPPIFINLKLRTHFSILFCYCLSPAIALIVRATIMVLNTKEIKLCIKTNRLITRELTTTSDT